MRMRTQGANVREITGETTCVLCTCSACPYFVSAARLKTTSKGPSSVLKAFSAPTTYIGQTDTRRVVCVCVCAVCVVCMHACVCACECVQNAHNQGKCRSYTARGFHVWKSFKCCVALLFAVHPRNVQCAASDLSNVTCM